MYDNTPDDEIRSAESGIERDYWPTACWKKSSPEEQGIDPDMLEIADKTIRENYHKINSLLVVRHGYLVYEKYYNGFQSSNKTNREHGADLIVSEIQKQLDIWRENNRGRN